MWRNGAWQLTRLSDRIWLVGLAGKHLNEVAIHGKDHRHGEPLRRAVAGSRRCPTLKGWVPKSSGITPARERAADWLLHPKCLHSGIYHSL